ncbi:HNH endonuclease [Pseudomonas sp. GX19020]|uniref:HNH endonuclease n=1 Tax=Pseudomonas sp. GX19020 TaxID=2942277 RepID=UPI002019B007|nr:HNH endonuclease [Pseudomonas sp. GX19020]MCL4068937.1 HNH endonuclease [Pseudomonas sp. GX19020]
MELLANPEPWKPTTSGERLLFLLAEYHQETRFLFETLRGAELRFGRRSEDLASFLIGTAVLHLQQRLIRLADDVREMSLPDRLAEVLELRKRTCDIIQLTPLEYSGDFGELIEEILVSAEQGNKEPTPAMKRAVMAHGPRHCYSCGRLFGAYFDDAPQGLKATVDHVWPRALGGDTVEANLLPACPSCNSKKGHLATWHMAWIQPVVLSDTDGLRTLPREVKMALHMRAATSYAQANGTTLRDAFLTIGPREPPAKVDVDQGYDFFNMRVHDEARTLVRWTPS